MRRPDKGSLSVLGKVLHRKEPYDTTINTSVFLVSSANEFRSWLFYWSLPVLRGVLPEEYYIHHSLLVIGCRLLA